MPHRKLIKDKDPCFVIDANTRTIKKQTVNRKTLMQYDHNSERFSFLIPKTIEGHDMMDCNKVEVHYINIDALTMEQNSGVYTVTDLQADTEDAAMLKCSWLISQNATKLSGSLNFLLRFACVAEDGTIEYAWNTEIFTGISVTSGIYNSEVIVEQYADVLEQWKKELENSGSGGGGGAVSSVNGKIGDVVLSANDVNAYSQIPGINITGRGIEIHSNSDKNMVLFAHRDDGSFEVHDITQKADKTDIPIKVSDLENDSGYLTEHQDITGKANKATTLSGYGITDAYTKDEVDAKIGSGGGSSSDLSDYVKKEDIEEINDKLFETYEEWDRLEQSVQWENGYYWTIPVSSNASYKYTNIAVSPGDVITYENVQRAGYSMRFIDAYNGDTRIEAASDNSDTKKYIVPEGVDNVFISILASVVDNGVYTLYVTRTEEKQIIRGTKGVNDFIFRNGLWVAEAETLPANTELIVVKNVDNKKNHAYDVYAEFSEFETVTIAHGKEGFQSSYIVIDSTTVKTYHCNSATTSVLMDTFEHGLTFDKFISVHINLEHKNRGLVSILTNGGEYSVDTAYFGGCKNQVSVTGGQDMTNVKASYFVRDVYADTWIFGDSYTSIGDPTKFPQHIINKKYTNFLISGFGGASSVNQYESLSRLIGMCVPKRICWCLGMNDGDTSTGVNENWNTVLGEVINLCNNKNVELILTTIPNVPNIRHDFKNQIVRESGYRYIDFAKAVNAETVGSTWYEGMLSSDNVHPSESGAKVLANRILLDVPELTL